MRTWIPLRFLALALLILLFAVAGCGAMYDHAPAAESPTAAKAQAVTAQVAADRPTTWKRSQIHANNARLAIGDREELRLISAEAAAQIDGFRARVVLDYTFLNDRDGRFEGNFQIRLPSDASPYYFAFGEVIAAAADAPPARDPSRPVAVEPARIREERAGTWASPQEARMVPRQKAARAYGDTVRRAVDPGLVEWAGAGVFNARVFPLQPRREHRIVIAYDMDLTAIGDDLELALDLPERAPKLSARVSVLAPASAAVSMAPAAAPVITGDRRHFHYVDPKETTLTLRVARPGAAAIVGEDLRTGAYFAASFRPEIPAPVKDEAARGPDAAVFLVDTSLSSNPDRFNVWLALLRAILDRNRDATRRFAVLFFDVAPRWYEPAFLDNTPENVDKLIAYAQGLALEGATDLGAALGEAAAPRWINASAPAAWDLFLLGDGAATWGEGDAFALAKRLTNTRARSLYAYQTGLAGTDTSMLDNLAREGRGAVFSVVGESEVAKAAIAHRSRPFSIESVSAPGVADLIVAGRPRVLFPGQRLTLAGRGALPAGAEVTIVLSRDGARREVRQKLGAPLPSALAPRVYGQIAVAQLEDLGAPTEALATKYATYFRVTGRTSSLLLLENEQEYARHGVVPEDPRAVVESAVVSTITRTLAAVGEALGDPKVGFFAWLDNLERTSGTRFSLPPGLREALRRLPSEAFAIDAEPLAPKSVTRDRLPRAFVEALAAHKLDYDDVVAEAGRRAREGGNAADALRALSSLVEERPGDSVLARDVAFSAMASGFGGHAYQLFRRVAAARPWEPQTYRAMAGCLVKLRRVDLAIALFEVALAGEWEARFGDFRQIVAMEYLHLLRTITSGGAQTALTSFAADRYARLSREVGPARADLVVMITWNTDNTDVDLHVHEPSGAECYYKNRSTWIGGELTRDVTQGYGPEMYVLPRAIRGEYRIRAHYFASDGNRASARTKVQALVFEDWGTARERVTERLITLERGKERHDVAVVWR